VGCSNPTTSSGGDEPNINGPVTPGGTGDTPSGGGSGNPVINYNLTADGLAKAFKTYDSIEVFIADGTVLEVAGVIPSGKTLIIKSEVIVTDTATLTVDGGTLKIDTTGTFTGTGVSSTGTVTLTSGTVQVDGLLAAPSAFYTVPTGATINYGTAGGALLASTVTAADVNTVLDKASRVEWAGVDALAATASATALSNWGTGKTLILTGTNALSGSLDLTGKGSLEIGGAWTLGTNAFKSNGNVTVLEGGSIALVAGTPALDGAITVKGTIGVTGTVAEIPASVDLSEGTLATSSADGVVEFAAPSPAIGTIAAAKNLEIKGATSLTVGTLSNSATATVTLPVTASIGTIVAPANLTIAGAGTKLTIDALNNTGASGAVAVALPATGTPLIKAINVVAAQNITFSGATALDTITTITASAVGTVTFPAIAVTVGTINASSALTIAGTSSTGATIKPTTISGAGGLTLGSDAKLDSSADITLTGSKIVADALAKLGANPDKIKGGTLDFGSTALSISTALTLNAALKTSGGVTFSANTTLNEGGDLTGDSTIGDNVVLTVGAGKTIVAGANLAFGPGKYTAGAKGFKFSATAITATDASASTLALGDATSGTKLTLKAIGAVATATFTPATKVVTLNGTGNGSITVAGGGKLTIGETAELILGDGAVLLGFDTTGGILTTAIGARISGFVRTGTLTAGSLTEAGDKSGDYNSGVAFALDTTKTTLSGGVISTATTAESALFTGLTPNGGAVTKNSKITPTT
jgi:hypothetical protein